VHVCARGSAYGWYNLAIGLGALPASLIFGAIWDGSSPQAAFPFGASLALVAAIGMTLVRPAFRTASKLPIGCCGLSTHGAGTGSGFAFCVA
jgi:hypothetical protein